MVCTGHFTDGSRLEPTKPPAALPGAGKGLRADATGVRAAGGVPQGLIALNDLTLSRLALRGFGKVISCLSGTLTSTLSR